jgi:hypothetical protein
MCRDVKQITVISITAILHIYKCSYAPEALPDICYKQVSCLLYSSALKIEAICSSETSADFQRTIQRHIPDGSTLHNHRCENLRSYLFQKCPLIHACCSVLEVEMNLL